LKFLRNRKYQKLINGFQKLKLEAVLIFLACFMDGSDLDFKEYSIASLESIVGFAKFKKDATNFAGKPSSI